MFFLKALFIRLYGALALLVSGWSLWQLLTVGGWLWLSPLLVWAPLWLLNLCRYHCCNLFYQDEREAPVMALALVGVALVLLAGERNLLLWLTLAGLFALLFYVVLASALTRGVREPKGHRHLLTELPFQDADGRDVRLQSDEQRSLVVFFHSAGNPYSRMQARELLASIAADRLASHRLICVFPDRLPPWSRALQARGVCCWVDADGLSSQRLGLWLRGGASGLLPLTGNALRPAVVIPGVAGRADYWDVAGNFRLPPSLTDLSRRLSG